MDWMRFLDESNIHYVTRGPNTKRGEVSIQCPMCGEDDPSEHLGINLQSGKWGCHRDQSHRGQSGRTLIKAILGCSSNHAWQVVQQYSKADPDDLAAAIASLEADGKPEESVDLQVQVRRQKLGPQFNDFSRIKPRGVTKRFFRYLEGRCADVVGMINRYDLRCALTGRYADRVILPVRLNGELLGWTSRAITNPVNAPRYLASNEEVKSTLYNYDNVKQGGERLFVCEGPFDAIKMDFSHVWRDGSCTHFKDMRAVATVATFGTSVTISQIALIRSLVKRYKEVFILFDYDADGPALELASWTGAQMAYLPYGVKDPGELTDYQLYELLAINFNGIPDIHCFGRDPFKPKRP